MQNAFSRVAAGLTLIVAFAASMPVLAQPAAVDAIFTNGKIVTVDEQFRIAEAVAVSGDRIVAVGTAADIGALAGTDTTTTDLGGRTVIPGLIDNHLHLLRAGLTWLQDVRLDGIESRAGALARLRARAERIPDGEWVFTLGGWMPDQFADDSSPFTLEELDRLIPDHPVLLQSGYYRT
jgi:predicted amidohydrolase YtcJ